MTAPIPSSFRRRQQGGLAIMVALTLLVFLTLVAGAMTRNSFRDIIQSGTTRQGAMARNQADSGIEWALFWLYPGNAPSASNISAQQFAQPNTGLIKTMLTNKIMGQYVCLNYGSAAAPNYYTVPGCQTMPSDLATTNPPAGVSEGFTIALMLMGKLQATDTSQGVLEGSFRKVVPGQDIMSPDLWAVRSDGQVTYGGVTFRQSSEAWITTPVQ